MARSAHVERRTLELRSSEELAARYIQLVSMSPSVFAGYEQELADVNEILWQREGFRAADTFIFRAREVFKLLGGTCE